MITIAYMTCRRNPRFQWFVDSLALQAPGERYELLVIDFYAGERDLAQCARDVGIQSMSYLPKPTVWQGVHRLTKQNFFAAANARNTAICLASGDYLVFADDLSVPLPTWFAAVKRAEQSGEPVCGTYEKALELRVQKGIITHKKYHMAGVDHRALVTKTRQPCPPEWFFGCSCGARVEHFLEINGYPEIADGMGYEDSVTGAAIAANGHTMYFDPEMATVESEEAHSEDVSFRRDDPGVSPRDKSHALLRACKGVKRFENYFGPGGIRGLRDSIQSGEPFPPIGIPEHEWFTGKRLCDL